MALPSSNFSDIIATSLQGYSGEIADNITHHNALLRQINKKGNKQTATGRTIVQELEYATNGTTMWYSGAENLDTSAQDTFTAAEYNYKQLAGNVVINGLEEIQNSGKEAVHNLLKARIRNLEKSLTEHPCHRALCGRHGHQLERAGRAGADRGGHQHQHGRRHLRSTPQSWWRNYVYDFSTNSVTASATTIQHAMNTAWINVIRGTDKPDIITADSTYWLYYLESLQVNQRFADDKGAGAGFTNVVYMTNVPVMYDDQCPATSMFLLNTDYLYLRPAKGREFKPLGEKSSVNQDAIVMPVVWAGNMTCSNRARQGLIQA
jgi:hypothetical protein